MQVVCATGARLHAAAFPDTSQGAGALAVTRAERLAAEVARVRAAGVAADGDLDPRVAEDALVSRARSHDVPLVVLGAVGHSVIERLLLGSVAGRVAMSSPVPVLVVREGGAWERWRAGSAPLRVAVAFDSGTSARGALAWAGWLASLGNVQLTVPGRPPRLRERAPGARRGRGRGSNSSRRRSTRLPASSPPASPGAPRCPVELQLEPNRGRIDSALIEFAHARHVDLLVVGSHQRHGFERLWGCFGIARRAASRADERGGRAFRLRRGKTGRREDGKTSTDPRAPHCGARGFSSRLPSSLSVFWGYRTSFRYCTRCGWSASGPFRFLRSSM
ncbi:MAG: universal stress protein [Gemmatimonadetes bacterium]|nr:universal stress protein [Gemmatimonadota bacterium]